MRQIVQSEFSSGYKVYFNPSHVDRNIVWFWVFFCIFYWTHKHSWQILLKQSCSIWDVPVPYVQVCWHRFVFFSMNPGEEHPVLQGHKCTFYDGRRYATLYIDDCMKKKKKKGISLWLKTSVVLQLYSTCKATCAWLKTKQRAIDIWGSIVQLQFTSHYTML